MYRLHEQRLKSFAFVQGRVLYSSLQRQFHKLYSKVANEVVPTIFQAMMK